MYGNMDFYTIKGVVERVIDTLGIKNAEFLPKRDIYWMHPGRTAEGEIDG